MLVGPPRPAPAPRARRARVGHRPRTVRVTFAQLAAGYASRIRSAATQRALDAVALDIAVDGRRWYLARRRAAAVGRVGTEMMMYWRMESVMENLWCAASLKARRDPSHMDGYLRLAVSEAQTIPASFTITHTRD